MRDGGEEMGFLKDIIHIPADIIGMIGGALSNAAMGLGEGLGTALEGVGQVGGEAMQMMMMPMMMMGGLTLMMTVMRD